MKTLIRSARVLIMGAAFLVSLGAFAAAKSVEQWGIYEVTLHGPKSGNPFVDVKLNATFTNGTETFKIPGFYDGDGVYRIRFMPDKTGHWRYKTYSNKWKMTAKEGDFDVTPPTGNDHGPVRVHNTYHFAYADGTPYWEIGTTMYSWTQRPEWIEKETLETLSKSPFNKVRMAVFPQDHDSDAMPPILFPYEGKPPRDWDYTRFNPAFFRHLEKRVGQLRDMGIQADIILFHPYGKTWGFESMNRKTDDRYLRYIVARLAAYRNVWWSMANEYDFIKTKNEADWDHIFQVVQKSDPYNHLRSIHNGALIYNNTKPWVTHASIQNGSAVESIGRAELYRDVYCKPIVYDEVKYEGNIDSRWGQLTGKEMVERFWNGTVAGCYVGHSETFANPQDVLWLGQGGMLRGESPPRLAFLKKILESSPISGIDPIDKWQDSDMGGKAGEYYLLYFDRKKPTSWTFKLYKEGLKDGMRFKIDILDTWNMTITPVDGVFTTKKLNRYYYVDKDGRSVKLPGKPFIALRIQRIGPAPAGDTDKNLDE